MISFFFILILSTLSNHAFSQSSQVEDDINLLISKTPFGQYDKYVETQAAYDRYAASPSEYISAIQGRFSLPGDNGLLTYDEVMTQGGLRHLLALLLNAAYDNHGREETILFLSQLYKETEEDYNLMYTELNENPPLDPGDLILLEQSIDAPMHLQLGILRGFAILGESSIMADVISGHVNAPYRTRVFIEGFSEFFTGSFPPPSFSMDLVTSWQLLGLPFEPFNPAYDSVFTDIPLLQPPFWWDSDRYVLENEVVVGHGYWAETDTSGVQPVMGIPVDTLDFDFSQGWQLFSGPSCDVPVTAIEDLGGIIIIGTLFGFDNGYVAADTLRQGQGYWMMTSAAGQVTLNCNATGAGKAGIPAIVYHPNATGLFAEFSIRDANRGRQTLYLGGTLINPGNVSFSLPPTPPLGFFDARFEGGTRLIEETEGLVKMQVSQYPITIELGGAATRSIVIEELVNGQVVATRMIGFGQSIEITNTAVTAFRVRAQ